ncbi:uncharacterized protein LOC142587940 [Dermacentor variabilis]|uniref:uncharacterized protein LOC142587940 n=1 Tax=Dermacentor variabilis TaxID=34621 RepID=UPI003F5B635A
MKILLGILATYILVCLVLTEGQLRKKKRMCSGIQKQSNCLGDKVGWQYDKEKGKCKPFLLGDCSRNKGFPTCRSCMKTCKTISSVYKREKGTKTTKDENYAGICPPLE